MSDSQEPKMSYVDMFVQRMYSHPEEFTRSRHTFVHNPSGVEVWISNGINHYEFYAGDGSRNKFNQEFTDLEKQTFDKAFVAWKSGAIDPKRDARNRMMHKYFVEGVGSSWYSKLRRLFS